MAEVARLQLPPHSIEAEQALLGSVLMSPAAWTFASKLSAEDFYRNDHRLIFGAIESLQRSCKAVDHLTVADHLAQQNRIDAAGGLAYIARLVRDTPSADNAETYAATVIERSSLRRLQAIGDEATRGAADGDRSATELAADMQEQLHRLQSRSRTGKGLVSARQLVGEFTDYLDDASAGVQGLQIGLPDFDELTSGLEAGDLVVFAARPGMGKTALLISIASTVSVDTGCAAFSAEMPAKQLMRRCMALQTNIAQGLLRRADKLGDDDWAKISAASEPLARRKLWIDDTATPTLTHIRAEALALKSRAELGLLLIDYVQLVRGIGKNRYEELRDVAYGLKALAKEMQLPIIVLAQLNRDVEKRDHKRPHSSDLRDSGAIEEAADVIGLLYSEAYYQPEFSMPYVLECSIEKNRNGERGHCLWRFDGAFSRVSPLESGAATQYRRLMAQPTKRGSSDL
jgi:replicative DNA helicase